MPPFHRWGQPSTSMVLIFCFIVTKEEKTCRRGVPGLNDQADKPTLMLPADLVDDAIVTSAGFSPTKLSYVGCLSSAFPAAHSPS